jgi:hypothetical protein
VLDEGWYLMSTADLEAELARWRLKDEELPASNARRLTVEDALSYRNAGNLPDEHDRTLRLVLRIDRADDLPAIDSKRRLYEPDYHERPSWRTVGSVPVNVVPLRDPGVRGRTELSWWEQPELKELEDEWTDRGTVAGVGVPEAYRGFVFKTVLALRAAGREVTAESLADSIARWVGPREAEEIRAALREAND